MQTEQGIIGGPGTEQQEPNALVLHEEPPRAPVAAGEQDNSTPALMRLALEKAGPDAVAALERLVGLQERIDNRAAAKAFFAAMARFKKKLALTPIVKNRTRQQGTDPGTSFTSTWATTDAIARVIDPICAEEGLSYRWTYRLETNNLIATCHVEHVDGHAQETPVSIPTESRAGMSPQQKIASAHTYGQRLSLIGAFGLTTADEGDLQQNRVDPTPITAEQASEIVKKLGANSIGLPKFLKALNIESVVEIPAARLPEVELLIEQTIQARAAKVAAQ